MPTVLVIEDDEENLALVSSLVNSFGNDVLSARTAHDGYDLIMSHNPDMILLDLRLPGMNGWELAAQLKSQTDTASIPIVAVSVEVESSDRRRAIDAGCDDYLAKPFPIDALRQMLIKYL